jgi:hypothetical protein
MKAQVERFRSALTIMLPVALVIGLWFGAYASPEITIALVALAAFVGLIRLLLNMTPAIYSCARKIRTATSQCVTRTWSIALRNAMTGAAILLLLPALIITIRYAIDGHVFRYNADSYLAVMAGLCAIAAAIILSRRRTS